MATKQIKRPEYIKHPFSKKKLRVLDSFSPGRDFVCPACSTLSVERILVVESSQAANYHVLVCKNCEKPNWFIVAR
jgi:transcription elongation factor Elf1